MSFSPSPAQKISLLSGLELMSHIFWGPSPERCEWLLQRPFLSCLDLLDQNMGNGSFEKLRLFLEQNLDTEKLNDELNQAYVRIFVSHKTGIIAPLYESCYAFDNAPLMGPPAMRMKGLLVSKGLDTSEQMNEPPDHLSIELEFLYFLLKTGWDHQDDTFVDEGRIFAAEVMKPWVRLFYEKLSNHDSESFYTLSASLTCSLLDLTAGMDRK